jgi:hypothetical protein
LINTMVACDLRDAEVHGLVWDTNNAVEKSPLLMLHQA